jgi:hypothetical protein
VGAYQTSDGKESICTKKESELSLQDEVKYKWVGVSVSGTTVTSIPSGFHMISHILHFLSFFVVGEAGVIGEAGTESSGASTTAGSFGATDDFERINSPVASSIDVRLSSPGDFGDENQAPGNNRDDVEDSYRPRGEIFETLGASPDMSRSSFGFSGASSKGSGTAGK